MTKRSISIVTVVTLASLLPFVTAPSGAQANPAPAPASAPVDHGKRPSDREDNRTHPLAARKDSLRQTAVDQLATQEARLVGTGGNRSIEMADGTKVDYPVSQHEQLLSFLVEFGGAGPLHDEIAKPRASDNSTYWRPDFDRSHYQDMFFNGMAEQGGESFKDFYREMSSGRFQLDGDVSDWVRVNRPESYYGANIEHGSESPERMAELIDDTADAWFTAQLAGRSDAQVKAYLAQYDQWDRYDADHDGKTHEPDGYIDHFQAIHAGEGEEAGADASTIWSHRSGASYWTDSGPTESTDCSACTHQGGVEIGDTGYYILDYTTEPENGGLGVFAHEFGHDLGLPDYYDTAGGDNGTGFWTLMSAGSWLGHGDGTLGTTPGHMGATEKLLLGWYGDPEDPANSDLTTVDGLAPDPQEVALGPSYRATTQGAQAVLVNLPKGHRTLDGPFADGTDGAYLYSGTRDAGFVGATGPPVTIPAGDPTLTARVAYQIEPGFDYAFLRVSTDDGTSWTDVPTDRSVDPGHTNAEDGDVFDLGITGVSGATDPAGADWRDLPVDWVPLSADLSAYAGQSVRLRWEYYTDPRTHGAGFAVDDVEVGSYATTYAAPDDWARDGFQAVANDEYTVEYPQYYLAENRQYRGYDKTLETGPYSQDHATTDPNRYDQFPYQDGLLVWYSNGFYGDNDSTFHPGGGANLPVDAGSQNQVWRDPDSGAPVGLVEDGRLQAYDATFDVDRTDVLRLRAEYGADHIALDVPSRPSTPVFEDADTDAYLDHSGGAHGEWYSTEVAGAGTEIQVLSSDETTGRMVLKVGKRFVAATGRPTVSDPPVQGSVVSATPPSWFQPVVTTKVRWLRDGAPITGATRSTYLVQAADVGHALSVSYTGSKAGYSATTVVSEAVTALLAAPAPTTPPAVLGTAQVGSRLTAEGATWPVAGTSTFTWSVAGTDVGAGATYVVAPGDLGQPVTLTETFASGGHAPATATAATAAVLVGAAPVASRGPRITGTTTVGSTLRATRATWPRAGTSTFAWSIRGTRVGTGTSYVLEPADAGQRVTLTERFISPGYAAGTAAAQSATVAKARVTLAVRAGKARRGERVAVSIHATAPRYLVPGTVRVAYAGRRLGPVVLRKGHATLRLPARARGTYRLTVTYPGATGFASTSRSIRVVVR
jgi:immune inhibitor A